MSDSEDVKALFRRFGGNASTYQEIVAHDQVGQAQQRWPMLRQIDPSHVQEPPSVNRVSRFEPLSRQVQEPVPVVAQQVAAQPVGGLFGRSAPVRGPAEPAPVSRGGGLHVAAPAPAPAPVPVPASTPVASAGFLASRLSAGGHGAHGGGAPVAAVAAAGGGAARGFLDKFRLTGAEKAPAAHSPEVPSRAPAPASGLAQRFGALSAEGGLKGEAQRGGLAASIFGQRREVAGGGSPGLQAVFSGKLGAKEAAPGSRPVVDAAAQRPSLGRVFDRIGAAAAVAPAVPTAPTAPVASVESKKRSVKW